MFLPGGSPHRGGETRRERGSFLFSRCKGNRCFFIVQIDIIYGMIYKNYLCNIFNALWLRSF